MPLAAGTRLGPYEVLAPIGAGGMGEVYKARDTRLDRTVAIKVLGAARLDDAEWKTRFVREAKAASALNHPHIVTIHDVGVDGDVAFIAMEYVAGRTLHELIGTKGLRLHDALRCLAQVADALSAAHEAGIVHRDLKPANVMVGDNGHVKLLDFGLAKVAQAGPIEQTETATAPATLTRAGTIVGTAAYMSPEQVSGRPVDRRTDVWAFGCVLYEALCGVRAFDAPSSVEILAKILQAEPDLGLLPAGTPATVRQLIRTCLQKDPEHRLRYLDPALLRAPDTAPEPIAPRRTRSKVAWAVLLLAAGAVAGWFVSSTVSPRPAAPPVVRLGMPLASSERPEAWNFPVVAVAPDGKALVYVSESAGAGQLYLRRMDRVDATPIAGTEGALSPFFSPDGGAVGFYAGGALKKVSLGDGVVSTLCKTTGAYGGAWLKSGDIVLGAFSGPLRRVSASGGTPEPLTVLAAGEAAHRWPAISLDGATVVYTTSNSTGPGLEEPRLVAQSLTSGRREFLTAEGTYALFAGDDNHLLVMQGGVATAVAFDASRLRTSGSQVPFIEGVMQSSTGAAQIGRSPSVLTYLRGALETRRLVWVDRQGRVEPLDAPPRLYVHPRLSPDGRRIAVATTETKNDIWIYDIARSALSRLTVEGSNAYPIWTPDGTKVAYVSSQEGRPPNVFWKPADGSGAAERLITSPRTQVTESWTPDGQTLFFVELRPQATGWDILTLPLGGSRQPVGFLETPFLDGTPQISPTGRYLAYVSTESGAGQVHVRSFPNPGIAVQVSTNGGGQAAWRGDEKELFFRSGNRMMVAPVTTAPQFSVGKPTVLFTGQFATIQGKNYDVTRDGQRFLMVRADEPPAPKEITVVLNWMQDLRTRVR